MLKRVRVPFWLVDGKVDKPLAKYRMDWQAVRSNPRGSSPLYSGSSFLGPLCGARRNAGN